VSRPEVYRPGQVAPVSAFYGVFRLYEQVPSKRIWRKQGQRFPAGDAWLYQLLEPREPEESPTKEA
jgi:hypothetical protein